MSALLWKYVKASAWDGCHGNGMSPVKEEMGGGTSQVERGYISMFRRTGTKRVHNARVHNECSLWVGYAFFSRIHLNYHESVCMCNRFILAKKKESCKRELTLCKAARAWTKKTSLSGAKAPRCTRHWRLLTEAAAAAFHVTDPLFNLDDYVDSFSLLKPPDVSFATKRWWDPFQGAC